MRLESLQLYKRYLARAIRETIEYREYSTIEAAKLAGTAPASISGLLTGRLEQDFTLDRLVHIALSLGLRVNITAERKWQRVSA